MTEIGRLRSAFRPSGASEIGPTDVRIWRRGQFSQMTETVLLVSTSFAPAVTGEWRRRPLRGIPEGRAELLDSTERNRAAQVAAAPPQLLKALVAVCPTHARPALGSCS
jgi:hypothetical protein